MYFIQYTYEIVGKKQTILFFSSKTTIKNGPRFCVRNRFKKKDNCYHGISIGKYVKGKPGENVCTQKTSLYVRKNLFKSKWKMFALTLLYDHLVRVSQLQIPLPFFFIIIIWDHVMLNTNFVWNKVIIFFLFMV